MKFIGIKSLDDLIIKTALVSLENIDEDFLNDFLNNLEILPDTLEIGAPSIVGPDYSVGIMSSYIEDGGASVKATTQISKGNLISIGLESGSIEKYIKDFIRNQAGKIVRDYSNDFAIIEELFVNAIYTQEVENAGFTLKDIKDDVKEGFDCIFVGMEPAKDNSIKIIMEFYA